MPLADPTPGRVSACPVHFLWDGRGHGRAFVRGGFLGLLAACVLWAAARTFVVDALLLPAGVVAGCAFAAYALGQLLSLRETTDPGSARAP